MIPHRPAAPFSLLVVLLGTSLLPAADPPPVRFREHLIRDNYGYAYGIGAADLDGDGDLDLVSSDTTNDTLLWFENNGKGGFTQRTIQKEEPGWFERLCIGDIDGDGRPDVVVVKNKDGDVVWFQNPGKPFSKSWARNVIIKGGLPGAYDVTLADFDGDGKPDVAASSWVRSNKFIWFKNPGKDDFDKEWPSQVIEEKVAETRTICAADFNGDGRPDLLGTATGASLVVWYENTGKAGGAPEWKKHAIDDKSPAPVHGHPADMDGDGDSDVVMAFGMRDGLAPKEGHQVVWYENVGKPGKGTEWKRHVVGDLPFAFEAIATDIDGDGKQDVVATSWAASQVVWFQHPAKEDGAWPMHVLKDKWPKANQVIAADFNKDGRIDLAAVAERGANEFRWWENEGKGEKKGADAINIANPKTLAAGKIECERIALGEADDYKPCVALLPSGELLLTAFHQHKEAGDKVLEQNLLFRSKDGGKTWSKPEKLDLLGREPYLTVLKDGTIFMTGHLLANDVRNKHGYTHGYLHRSTDAGKSWESIRVESEGVKPKASNHTSRNVLQLADGSLLLGVDYDGGGGPYLAWRSTDGGKTWDRSQKCEPRDFKSVYGFFGGETWLWQAKSGKVWALVRVDSNEFPIKDRPIKSKNDQSDHFILFSSDNQGKTFDRVRDFGDYGEMYLSLLRLQDKRLLLTFTVRDLKPPLGVRALVGDETEDGFEFDFARDRVMLDTRTPVGKSQGGGFGPTVQLKDGTLVTSYSYRGEDEKTHLEVVRWQLPAFNK